MFVGKTPYLQWDTSMASKSHTLLVFGSWALLTSNLRTSSNISSSLVGKTLFMDDPFKYN